MEEKLILHLQRTRSTENGTFGALYIEGLPMLYTVERPWLNNEPDVSCIPAGEYRLKLRNSPLITRITKGERSQGYEVTGVPGRSFVMIHPANLANELNGCIAPGMRLGEIDGVPAVLHSRQAFELIMNRLEGIECPILEVR